MTDLLAYARYCEVLPVPCLLAVVLASPCTAREPGHAPWQQFVTRVSSVQIASGRRARAQTTQGGRPFLQSHEGQLCAAAVVASWYLMGFAPKCVNAARAQSTWHCRQALHVSTARYCCGCAQSHCTLSLRVLQDVCMRATDHDGLLACRQAGAASSTHMQTFLRALMSQKQASCPCCTPQTTTLHSGAWRSCIPSIRASSAKSLPACSEIVHLHGRCGTVVMQRARSQTMGSDRGMHSSLASTCCASPATVPGNMANWTCKRAISPCDAAAALPAVCRVLAR